MTVSPPMPPWERHSVRVHPPLSAPSWMGTEETPPLEHWAVVHSYVCPLFRTISTPPLQGHIFSRPHKKKEKTGRGLQCSCSLTLKHRIRSHIERTFSKD